MLALVNDIYFKRQWDSKFEKKNTRKMPFRLSKVQLGQELWEAGESGGTADDLCSADCRASCCLAQA